MTSPNLPEFDGNNLRIILPAGITNIDVEADLYSQWKEWVKLSDNAKFPPAFRTIGGDPLTPGIDAGAYFFIQNQDGWRIRPAEEDATVFLNGNLAPEDSALDIVVPTLGNFRVLVVNLQPITQNVDALLEFSQTAEYRGVVHLHLDGTGTAGTTYPTGTEQQPCNNLTDAKVLLAALGFSTLHIKGPLVLDQDLTNVDVIGQGTLVSVGFNGFDISGSEFTRCGIYGAVGSPSSPESLTIFEECTVAGPITNFAGVLQRCILQGDITLRSGETYLYECASGVAGSNPGGNIDGGGAGGIDLVVRGYNGGIGIQGFTGSPGATMTLGMATGKVTLRASNTAFTDVQVRGVAELVNLTGLPQGIGKTIDTEGLITGSDVKLIKAMTAGDVEVSLNDRTVTVYEAEPDLESPRTVLAVYDISADGRIRTRTS